MKVIFKYVGQGDSIILNWFRGTEEYIGIIDCNILGITNPVLEYIKTKKTAKLEFVILSHPHSDHFSGLYQLLTYFEENNITLKYFLHTCASVKEYLKNAVRSNPDRKLLRMIFTLATSLCARGIIQGMGFVNNFTSDLHLTDDISLKFLGPSDKFYQKYNKTAFKNDSLLNNNPNANYLSTFIMVYDKTSSVLLTSDVDSEVFWDLNRQGKGWCKGKLKIGQISHHGAKDNFYQAFWKLVFNSTNSIAAISFGVGNSYGHPDPNVVNDLKTLGYQVMTTGLLGVAAPSSFAGNLLNLVSSPVASNASGQDLEFDVF
jgi:competence protein ComEC